MPHHGYLRQAKIEVVDSEGALVMLQIFPVDTGETYTVRMTMIDCLDIESVRASDLARPLAPRCAFETDRYTDESTPS